MATPETERDGLQRFLNWQRETLIKKVAGLTEAQARSTPTISALSLLSIVKHSAVWERRWFQVVVAGRRFPGEWPEVHDANGDVTFALDETETVASVVAEYRREIAASNEILDTFDLDTPCTLPAIADRTLRWVALHLIEETARHAGHADIIRETIDATQPS